MKRMIPIAIALLALLATGNLLAQICEATVPFDFIASTSALPSGTYRINPVSAHIVVLHSTDLQNSVLAMTLPGYVKPGEPSVLIFSRYGDQYFLREIHAPWASNTSVLPVSSMERRAREEQATVRTWEQIQIPKR